MFTLNKPTKDKSTIFAIILFGLLGCAESEESQNPVPTVANENFDIILVMGQSNTHYGVGYNPVLDAPHERIKQFGRFGDGNYNILTAQEPLDHITKQDGRIGFALTFAKLYTEKFLGEGRDVLIIPAGHWDTGFVDNRWNKGDDLYNDALERANYVLEQFPESKLISILWHQGEKDIHNESYQENLDAFIDNIRSDLNNEELPFILGGLVPHWTDQTLVRLDQQNLLKAVPERKSMVGYADPVLPFVIEKENPELDPIHFDAAGLRELGKRYFNVYNDLVQP